jgi:hypothetical protein
MNARVLLPLTLALAAGCGYKPAVQSDAAKQPAYVFPHSTHVDADVKCTECHGDVVMAARLDPAKRSVRLPRQPSKTKACADCHDKDPKVTVPARSRDFRVRFSHADHVSRVGGDCRKCHRELTEPGDKVAKTPPMETCTSCHNHQADFNEARCTPCHVDLKGYKPVTAFRHEGNWIATHGALARPAAESCAACHDQTYCATCHSAATSATRLENIFPERVDRSFIHRGDYVSRHMVDSSASPASCKRCHGSGFCDSCHAAQGVSRSAGTALRDPHPQGWSNTTDGGQHRFAARRDITSCAGCHDQGAQANCVLCHSATGLAGAPGRNPHPAKFLRTHSLSDTRDNDMCRACHR